jgi:quercetin dioxygenase-like cupin family protein
VQTTNTTAGDSADEPYLDAHDPRRGTTVLADAGRTRGAFGVAVCDLRVGDARSWCRHTGEDVAYLVVEGDVEFRVADHVWTVQPVSLVFAPRHAAHCYRALTDARVVVLAVPAGLERFVETSTAAGDAALLLALAQEHRVEVLPDLLS